MNNTQPAVRFDNVSILFGEAIETGLSLADEGKDRSEIKAKTACVLGVHDCSLEVGHGETVVLMGLSGSGKSTLIRAANGLAPVVRGSVQVSDGSRMIDMTRSDPATLRRMRQQRITMVFQQVGLLPWRTVRENVALGLELAGMSTAEQARRCDEQLDLVGLSGWAECKISELSGGMQQRVGLARALATHAPILLMDEPFSALDPLIRKKLQEELLELQKELQRTILFVSHDLDEAFKIGNRIAIMEGGRIVQCGTPQQIYSAPANGHVADFVANMNPLDVLRARDLLEHEPGNDRALGGPAVSPDTTVREVIRTMADADTPLEVSEGSNRLGHITKEQVLAKLLNPQGKA